MAKRFVVGIDEVGRGSLAGPVVVAAACMPWRWRVRNSHLGKLKDSKKLTAMQREQWYHYFKEHPLVSYALARVYPRTIERINVARAANTAALRAFRRLSLRYNLTPHNCVVRLDGGLYLGMRSERKGVKTVTKGDEKFTAIKAASVIAKVNRDYTMARLAQQYPEYGFEIHKGYGTKKHLHALKQHGPSKAHRLTFLKKYHTITRKWVAYQ